VGAGKSQGLPSRSLITSNATSGSGGINTAALGAIPAAADSRVAPPRWSRGSIGGDGGGGAGGGGTLRRGGSGKASRSIEDIKLVFDRNKGSIYTLYNRALREDPTLQGKVVVKLTIAPSGRYWTASSSRASCVRRISSARSFLRIKQFDFGAKAVDAMVVTYPIDFPAVVTDSA